MGGRNIGVDGDPTSIIGPRINQRIDENLGQALEAKRLRIVNLPFERHGGSENGLNNKRLLVRQSKIAKRC
jgi:hypothetical protein